MFYAYGVAGNQVTLVRCASHDDALLERGRLKMSDCRTVGSTNRRVSESEIVAACKGRGWNVQAIRDFR